MVGDLLGAVIGHVAHDDATPAGRLQVHVVEADAAADDAATLRELGEGALGQLDVVIDQQHVGRAAGADDLGLVVGLQ